MQDGIGFAYQGHKILIELLEDDSMLGKGCDLSLVPIKGLAANHHCIIAVTCCSSNRGQVFSAGPMRGPMHLNLLRHLTRTALTSGHDTACLLLSAGQGCEDCAPS